MPCDPIVSGDGKVVGLACSRGRRGRQRRKCVGCGRPADYLCDGPGTGRRTCDAPVCASCKVADGPDRDLCPEHAKAIATR